MNRMLVVSDCKSCSIRKEREQSQDYDYTCGITGDRVGLKIDSNFPAFCPLIETEEMTKEQDATFHKEAWKNIHEQDAVYSGIDNKCKGCGEEIVGESYNGYCGDCACLECGCHLKTEDERSCGFCENCEDK